MIGSSTCPALPIPAKAAVKTKNVLISRLRSILRDLELRQPKISKGIDEYLDKGLTLFRSFF